MKKNLLLIVGIAFLTMYACTNDAQSSQNKEISSFKRNTEPIFARRPPMQGGAYGAGIEGAEFISREEGCRFDPVICYAIPMFEGVGEPNVSIVLLSEHKMRIHFLSEISKVTPEQLARLDYLREYDLKSMANFMNTHYYIPTLNRIDDRINRKIIDNYGFGKESVLYILPKKYKRITSEEYPFGYIDVDIHVHPNREVLPDIEHPCNPGCTLEWIGYNTGSNGPWGCKCY